MIVLYDGACNLCNTAVQLIAANDPAQRFRFAPLQSADGAAELAAFGRRAEGFDSVVLIDRDGLHERSAAALRIAMWLRPPWPLAAAAYLVPSQWRDALYDAIARNRHAWFGRRG